MRLRMKEELKDIIKSEYEATKEILSLLELQHDYLIKNDVLGIQEINASLSDGSKKLAEYEVKRRGLVKEKSIKTVINEIDDNELDRAFRDLKMLISQAILQKDINETLIKQGISFTTRMLSILNPDRAIKTYNSYGKFKK
jgi:flagellar biosynthesis/type III secretory pathway chaperone